MSLLRGSNILFTNISFPLEVVHLCAQLPPAVFFHKNCPHFLKKWHLLAQLPQAAFFHKSDPFIKKQKMMPSFVGCLLQEFSTTKQLRNKYWAALKDWNWTIIDLFSSSQSSTSHLRWNLISKASDHYPDALVQLHFAIEKYRGMGGKQTCALLSNT